MAWRTPHRCYETTLTQGVGSAGNPYVLQGPVDIGLWRSFSNAMSNGDQAEFVVMQQGAGGSALKMERFTGTYLSGPNAIRPDQLHESTSGGWSPSPISWGSGTRDIFPTLAIEPMDNLIDPVKGGDPTTQGLVVRASPSNFLHRKFMLGTKALDAFALAHPAGLTDNPTLELIHNLLARDAAATDAARTMLGPLLLATQYLQYDLLVNPNDTFYFRGRSPADIAMQFKKLGIGNSDFRTELGVGGALKRVLTIADISQIIDLKFKFSSATGADVAGLQNDTSMSFTTPYAADGSEFYVIVLFGVVNAYVQRSTGTGTSQALVYIRDGLTPVSLSTVSMYLNAQVVITANSQHSVPVFHARPASAGLTYTFDLSADVSSSGSSLNASGGIDNHVLIGACLRVG